MSESNPDGKSCDRSFELLRMEDVQGVSLLRLPGRHRHHRYAGYVYIVQMDNGVIKVGKTSNPSERIATHAKNAAPHGSTIIRLWLSVAHLDSAEVEKELIRQASHACSSVIRSEYFTGLDFGHLADAAAKSRYRPIDLATIAAMQREAAIPPFGPIEVSPEKGDDFVELARERIRALLGRRSNGTYQPPMSFGGGTPEEWRSVIAAVAQARGCTVAEVHDMTRLDLLHALVASVVRVEVLELQAHAQRTGHFEYLETMGDVLAHAELVESSQA